MINKQNNDNSAELSSEKEKESGYVDSAKMDVQCHIVIKDKDTGETLVNKRG